MTRHCTTPLLCVDQDELQALKLSPEGRLSQMKVRADELKDVREEERKKVAQDKLYQHWRSNNPEIRQVGCQMLKLKAVCYLCTVLCVILTAAAGNEGA